ncbi:hypothetical protein LH417_07840 [Laribacter hongkongensis]|uniref:hypothetical protein n=1 Tax=Laribacter hongkongensis TaxID=168471 RepID=UPI001EFCAAE0|nr:hypothetical protein [Laribacter hongkongensis]MCG9022854.1 hypothetical protein [Laribacter hongkongensis]
MIASSSRQTLLANMMQQGAAAALLLILPNMLDKEGYAQVVFVGVLLGFMALADLGLSLVYSRVVPGLVMRDDAATIRRWDASVAVFGSAAAIFFSLVLALVYWIKYRQIGHALILFALPMGLYWVAFHITRMTAAGRFDEYRRVIGARSLAALLAIPFAMVGGISAWFISQVIAALLVMARVGRELWQPMGQVDWTLLRRHLLEALQLCMVTAAWVQLLNFGRLYASLVYPSEAVARYGVAGSAYQSISTLLISAFIPVSVGLLGRLGKDDLKAFEYMKTVLARTVWWVLAGALAATEMAIQVLGVVFQGYHFDTAVLLGLMSGIALYPFFLLLGNCMVGKQKTLLYLAMIAIALGAGSLVALVVDEYYSEHGAAWGQLAGLITFTFSLFLVSKHLFGSAGNYVWDHIGLLLLGSCIVVVLYISLRI